MDTTRPARKVPSREGIVEARRKQHRNAALLIAPTLIVLAIVIGYPILRAIYLSFQADKGLDPVTGLFTQGGFAGLEHDAYWLTQRCGTSSGSAIACPPGVIATDFWPAVGNTLFFTVVTVTLEIVLGMGMALVMNREFRGRALVRAAVLIPWAIPTAVTAKLWQFIFADKGIVNSLLHTPIQWTTDPWAARFAVIIADVWKTTPFMALLILAGLQMIPKDVYEAARVDGANTWQQFLQITLPLVKPALMVAVLFRTLDALRMYDLPVILISSSSNSPTATISQLVVEDVRQNHFNSASALSTLIFLLIFAVAFLMIRVLGADVTGRENTPKQRRQRGQRGRGKHQKRDNSMAPKERTATAP
ncbi:carbohydrate ABC transporter permease [Corynebacterium pseudotuberculosis]|uniref:carbohydrate ABC transporter permease n=1 Tax=Corynebacterium pseudotuberculosis TaxID=1719 RepID=UPI000655722E|nr:sugar ABC transporter permease [Corynebacterium pseudotuberculosis]AFH90336.2 ABC transporter permease subunit [Corynebacterium pseudotuberculosis 31]